MKCKMKYKTTGKIVTFSCQKSIHIYKKNGIVAPYPPYKVHATIEAAKESLEERGINVHTIIEHK